MSLATWLKKYYPVKASDAASNDIEACEHSLRKWRGLSLTILKKHKVNKNTFAILDDADSLDIDDRSCALCVRHNDALNGCPSCPITKATGKICCDDSSMNSPYATWDYTGNHAPMIKVLEKALAYAKKQAGPTQGT